MTNHLTLPYPPTANHFRRTVVIAGRSRQVLTQEAKAYKEEVALLATIARMKPIDGGVCVVVRAYRPRRRGDLDNTLKTTLDALSGIAYHDDEQIVSIYATRYEDKANPRLEIEITANESENAA